MEVTRKPHQIILIEHIFYPAMGAIFFILGSGYGPKVAAIYTDLQVKDIYEITIFIGAVILSLIALLALPYSFIRLWVSSNHYLSGLWRIASKSYSVIALFLCVAYGILMLISLPSLYVSATNI